MYLLDALFASSRGGGTFNSNITLPAGQVGAGTLPSNVTIQAASIGTINASSISGYINSGNINSVNVAALYGTISAGSVAGTFNNCNFYVGNYSGAGGSGVGISSSGFQVGYVSITGNGTNQNTISIGGSYSCSMTGGVANSGFYVSTGGKGVVLVTF